MADPVRLQKVLANAGVASRRKAEELIRAGRVRVNGQVITELGTRVDTDADRIEVGGREVIRKPPVWIALNKPPGYLTSRGDPQGRPTIYELLPLEYRGLFYVGRLDFETEGLVLLTNDGDRAHRLQHPRFQVPRVYEVVVEGEIAERSLRQLRRGVRLEDGPARLRDARVLRSTTDVTELRVSLAEGRKREVRRLFDAVGHPVLQLCRVRYGPIALGNLERGRWRKLGAAELAALDSGSDERWT
jgi:23S rRNA pseudouridine2605 synthase